MSESNLTGMMPGPAADAKDDANGNTLCQHIHHLALCLCVVVCDENVSHKNRTQTCGRKFCAFTSNQSNEIVNIDFQKLKYTQTHTRIHLGSMHSSAHATVAQAIAK